MAILLFIVGCGLGATAYWRDWSPDSGYRMTCVILSAAMFAMSLVAASIGVTVQLINFRFLELDSLLRRRRRGEPTAAQHGERYEQDA